MSPISTNVSPSLVRGIAKATWAPEKPVMVGASATSKRGLERKGRSAPIRDVLPRLPHATVTEPAPGGWFDTDSSAAGSCGLETVAELVRSRLGALVARCRSRRDWYAHPATVSSGRRSEPARVWNPTTWLFASDASVPISRWCQMPGTRWLAGYHVDVEHDDGGDGRHHGDEREDVERPGLHGNCSLTLFDVLPR